MAISLYLQDNIHGGQWRKNGIEDNYDYFRVELLMANSHIRNSWTYTGYDAKTVPYSIQRKMIFHLNSKLPPYSLTPHPNLTRNCYMV